MSKDYQNIVASLMALVGNDSVITVHRPLVDFTGSLEAGMMLSQLLYWTPRAKVPGGWVAKTDDEFHQELCLSKYGVRQGRSALEAMGILETKVKKFNGTPMVHYRLNLDALNEKWNLWIQNLDFAISQNPNCENAKSLTEITTETTTKTNNTNNTKNGVVPEATALQQTPHKHNPGVNQTVMKRQEPPETPEPPAAFEQMEPLEAKCWRELASALITFNPLTLEQFCEIWDDHPDERRHNFALDQMKRFADSPSFGYYKTCFLRYDPDKPKPPPAPPRAKTRADSPYKLLTD